MSISQAPSKPSYRWVQHSQIRVDADMASLEFMAVRAANQGRLTPEAVLQRAERKDSILHDEFTWDDVEAARITRMDEARKLIRSLVVVYQREDPITQVVEEMRPIPQYIRVQPHADTPAVTDFEQKITEKGVYAPIEEIMADTGARRLLLHQAWRAFAGLRQKYRDLSEFSEIFEAIDRAKATIA